MRKNKTMKLGTIKNVCFVENIYTLLLYMLISEENFQDNTFFFFSSKVPSKITHRFNYYKIYSFPENDLLRLPYIFLLRIIKFLKYPFLKTASLYGQDNLPFTSPLVGYRKMKLIEDGVMNYSLTAGRSLGWVKGIIGGPIMAQPPFGLSSAIERIYLTGLGTIPNVVKHKVELINLSNLWKQCSNEKKKQILSDFGVSEKMIEDFKDVDSVLFTQPLSEDGAVDEKTKISFYATIIKDNKISIKPHPREKTNYKNYFPNVSILEPTIPIELLTLLGIKFKRTYTIFSTAVLSFPYSTEVHFLGTQIHPSLIEKFGDIRYENGKIKRIDLDV